MRVLGAVLKRPIATGAAFVALLALGLAAIPGLPVGIAPDLDFPRLTVELVWPNASPETVEALVTSPVEGALAGLPGLREIASTSGPGWGWVDVAFRRGTRMDVVEVLVRERLAGLREKLPEAMAAPRLTRTVPDEVDPGQFFVLRLSGARTPEALRALLEDRVLPQLAAVPGVSDATAYGGARPEIRVDLDRETVERGAVRPANLDLALDRVGTGSALGAWPRDERQVPIVLDRAEVNAGSVRDRHTARADLLVPVGQVAAVVDTWETPRALARLDGEPSVQGVLERAAGTNVVRVARQVRDRLDEIRETLPPDVALRVIHDESETIAEELSVLGRRSAISLGLILAVLLIARRGARASLVVVSSVLFSALATFLLFRFTGLGLNLVTLSGLALAFGMAVDNSIVLLENVALRVGNRRNPVRTLAAVREVLFPLLAATATTAVVTTPFLYLEDGVRDAYLPFVLAVVLSLVASLVVALTWSPLLAPWALGSGGGGQRGGARSGGTPGRGTPGPGTPRGRNPHGPRRPAANPRGLRVFSAILTRMLRRPWIPVTVSLLILGASLWVFDRKVQKGSIFSPEPDTTLRVALGLPPGAQIEKTDALLRTFEDHVLQHEFRENGWVEQVEAFVTTDRGNLTVRFPGPVAWTGIPAALKDELSMRAATISGADVSVTGHGPGFSRGRSSVSPAYQLRLTGPDYERLGQLTQGVADLLGRNRRVKNLDTNGAGFFVEDARELVLIPDRPRLARAGVTMSDLTATLRPAIASDLGARRWMGPDGEVTGRIRFAGGEDLPVTELLELLVTTPAGARVRLGDLARIEERGLPGEIRRRDQAYERQIRFEYRGPRRVGDRLVRSLVENTSLPAGYEMEDGLGLFLTSAQENEIHLGIAFALVLITIVSAALFESLVLPFVAMLSVPLSFVAIPFTFWATGDSFDRTAYVGLILLAGIAINNALLLVHRAGRLHRRLGDATGAARRAAVERARPILLTTATSVAGLVPLIWQGQEAMSGTWRSLALSATAGLIASAAFTLFVIPCLFALLARRRPHGPAAVPSLRLLKGDTA